MDLRDAVEFEDVDKVRGLLESGRYSVNSKQSWWERTSLHWACAKGNLDMARMLIKEFKADMTIQDRDDNTPLLLAIKYDHDNVAHALLEDYQCPVDVRDKDGNTVLHYACEYNATQSMKTLIQKYKAALGGDVYVPMCVVAAAVSGDVGIVKDLLDHSNLI